ncbi:hypothetical protein LTR36_009341 [Oleoguttula mirabilis]|uniref:Lipid droplet-associated hydrolase n=1 Tax=Oleoguttula mirabilis TaxID=1507867 RepID=A0AAV9JTT9_9PEZI|nr:hypothetical protein LTR36_009341 [Oleoguttula mirabilis]
MFFGAYNEKSSIAKVMQDEIDLHPEPSLTSKRRLLVYFITGNPGLIEYYRVFLTQLYDILRVQDPKLDLHIYGSSLAGFEISNDPPRPIAAHNGPPYGLDEQIEISAMRLLDTVKQINDTAGPDAEPFPVVLIGHSVGAYMLLEIIARWQSMANIAESKTAMNIAGGICLFPTVVDIAKSPTGQRMAPLLRIPGFSLLIHLIAKLLFSCMPIFLMIRLVQIITFMPYNAAKTTAAFIQSKHGVRQALFMAHHEMVQMSHDKWSDDLWGVRPLQEAASTAMGKSVVKPAARLRLYFYWGRDDHWIECATRNKLIRTRGRTRLGRRGSVGEENKPLMEIDRNGVPHGFCIRHSEVIAEKVAEYVTEIANGL